LPLRPAGRLEGGHPADLLADPGGHVLGAMGIPGDRTYQLDLDLHPYNFLPYDPDQLFLLPPSIAEWVGEGSLARFVATWWKSWTPGAGWRRSTPATTRTAGAGRASTRGCWSRCCSTATAAG